MSVADQWNPADPENKARTRESFRQVRGLLLGWDPIGVAETDSDGEYDFMISPLLHQLHDGASEDVILSWIASQRDYMGLGPDRVGRDRKLTADLMTWWQRRISGP
jgi:hypothetical protein